MRALQTTALAAACLAVAAGGPALRADAAPLTLVYDISSVVQRLANPPSGRALTPARGALRQDPGGGGMFAPGDNSRYRVAKVSGAALEQMGAGGIAATLRREIALGSHGARSHLVAIDEIGGRFGDAPPARPRRGQALRPVDPASPGARFTAAMRALNTESPWGGTWASRVLVYLAPAVHTSIAAGRGPERNLGRDGKPHRRTWRGVMPGLALAGAVNLQMFHATGGTPRAFPAGRWRAVPGAFTRLFARHGGDPSRVHFIFTATDTPPGAPRSCGARMACQWRLAESTPMGRTVLANGPGLYRVGDQAGAWLREFNRRF
jgi:hypothetical protein